MCPIHFPLPAVHRTKRAFWEIFHREFRSTRPVLVLLCPRAFSLVPDWYYDVLRCDVLTAAWKWMSVLSSSYLTGKISALLEMFPFGTGPSGAKCSLSLCPFTFLCLSVLNYQVNELALTRTLRCGSAGLASQVASPS